jgi:hypothetical protein
VDDADEQLARLRSEIVIGLFKKPPASSEAEPETLLKAWNQLDDRLSRADQDTHLRVAGQVWEGVHLTHHIDIGETIRHFYLADLAGDPNTPPKGQERKMRELSPEAQRILENLKIGEA